MNQLREKLSRGERVYGSLVSLTDPCLCEIMGRVGYDCVWIDMEHTYISERDALCHLNAARATGIASLVRVPQHDLSETKRILEMGPDAILFPMVRSAAEARELIDMTLYPPLGNRGFGPMRAIGYGAEDAAAYVDAKSLVDTCRFMQIEHVSMINELDEIAANPYVDGFIFGPNDLSGSVGEMLRVFDETTAAEMRRAIAIMKKHGKPFGIACGADQRALDYWSSFAPDMLFAGADWCFVYSAGIDTLKRMRTAMV